MDVRVGFAHIHESISSNKATQSNPNPMLHLQSTKEMTFPVLPPTFLRAEAALVSTGPAAEVARERPWEALEAVEEAASAPLAAASEVEEACLTAVLRVRNCDCRRTAREAVTGILKVAGKGGWEEKALRRSGAVQESPMGEKQRPNTGTPRTYRTRI